MAYSDSTATLVRADHTVVDDRSEADRATFAAASYVRRPRPFAADDHGKTKDPLSSRPRGPHPYRVVAS